MVMVGVTMTVVTVGMAVKPVSGSGFTGFMGMGVHDHERPRSPFPPRKQSHSYVVPVIPHFTA